MVRALALVMLLALAACAAETTQPWAVEGEIPFDGKLLYRN